MLPSMLKIRQLFEENNPKDPALATQQELRRIGVSQIIKRGDRVGIAVGSRGIRDLKTILQILTMDVESLGATPVFIPAMGSHGGATPEQQYEIVRELVGEELSHVPILADMDVEEVIGKEGLPFLFSSSALKMDKLIPVNRIKPHTDFSGRIGSGLVKMLVIGLGKQKGAEKCHVAGKKFGMERTIREGISALLNRVSLAFGIAIVENAYDKTVRISAVTPGDLIEEEEKLFQEAVRLMPRLPFDEIDILIIDEMGKDISGNGMDTNVIGRFDNHAQPIFRIERIFVRDLSKASHGNAIGLGLADVTTKRLVNKVDLHATRVNCLTSLSLDSGKVPLAFENDFEALKALAAISGKEDHQLKLVWIKNTLELEFCAISVSYGSELAARSDLVQQGEEFSVHFDRDLNLTNSWAA